MGLRINSLAPDFAADTTYGRLKFHDWLGDSWGVLFSHPKDYTPVCTTELGTVARLLPEFEKRGVKVIGLSVDPVDRHEGWARDIAETQGAEVTYPLIGDTDLHVAKLYNMLPEDIEGTAECRTPADNATVRTVFLIGPDKRVKAQFAYPMSSGRIFHEILRLIDSLQLTARHQVATPAQWEPGDDVIILPSVSDDDARAKYPDGWTAPKPYLRIIPQPG